MGIAISDKDIEWITTRYPGLSIDREDGTIIGELSFTRSHEGKVISDTYTLKILLEPLKGSMLPQVYELSNKITDTAIKYGKELIDMHINTDKNNSFCLGIYDDEKKLFNFSFTIQEFFENSLESYLYWQSYFSKYGVPPWAEYAHGVWGYIEYFAENDMSLSRLETIVSTKVLSECLYHFDNIHDKCLCGNKQSMYRCHPLLYHGIEKIKYKLATSDKLQNKIYIGKLRKWVSLLEAT